MMDHSSLPEVSTPGNSLRQEDKKSCAGTKTSHKPGERHDRTAAGQLPPRGVPHGKPGNNRWALWSRLQQWRSRPPRYATVPQRQAGQAPPGHGAAVLHGIPDHLIDAWVGLVAARVVLCPHDLIQQEAAASRCMWGTAELRLIQPNLPSLKVCSLLAHIPHVLAALQANHREV
eukprot:CAMPEP_0183445088 /NCGR_PEP_ID=MMETSP0370-20130417/96104_1 /TAXON_ID=268820 /ORGANISM="Peridinium aciculiferum, Strain PAER-2" /LENGTH=173 /DNA_ID=CAMNT_0025635599 /DNA_START=168 /DNA_END=691 /DNA_ORIENTATION=-